MYLLLQILKRMKLILFILALFIGQTASGQTVNTEKEIEEGIADFQNGMFQSSLEHLEKAVNVLSISENCSNDYAVLYMLCGISASQIGDIKKSTYYIEKGLSEQNLPIEYRIQMLCIQLENYNKLDKDEGEIIEKLEHYYSGNIPNTYRTDIIVSLLSYYVEHQRNDKVLMYENKLPKMTIKDANPDNELTAMKNWNTIYMTLGFFFSKNDNPQKALLYYKKAIKTLTPMTERNRTIIYSLIVKELLKQGDTETALKYQQKAIDLIYKSNLNDTTYLADQLLQLGTLYMDREDYQQALKQLGEADSLYIGLHDIESHAYTQTLIYHIWNIRGNKTQCKKIRKFLESVIAKVEIKDREKSLIIKGKVAEFFKDDGEYQQALKFYHETINIAISIYGSQSDKLYPYYYNLAALYGDIGNYNVAIEFVKELKSLPINQNSKEYYDLILLECNILQEQGHIGKAISILESASAQIESAQSLAETKSSLYSTLGSMYGEIADFDRALFYNEKSLKLANEIYGNNSQYYAIELLNISEIYAVIGRQSDALLHTQTAYKIIKKLYGEKHPLYYKCLHKLASRYLFIDDTKSMNLYKKCLILSKELYGEMSNEYADNLFSISNMISSLDKKIKMMSQALEIKKKHGAFINEYYLADENLYASLLFLKQDWVNLYKTGLDLMDICSKYIISNFRNLSYQQRESLWHSASQALSGIECYATNYTTYAVKNNDYTLINEFGKLAYDVRLLKKGLLLSSSIRLDEILAQANDSIVSVLEQEISELQQKKRINGTNVEERENLERDISNKERELINIASQNGDFLDFTSIRWTDIQEALKPGEVAIEFFSYPVQNTMQYGAVWLTSSSSPTAFGIFTENELDAFRIGGESIYNYKDPGIYKTVWGVLEAFSEIRNAHTIYFSTDGILNTIGIESLCDSMGHLASEKHQLYRLSSTRELIRRNNRTNYKKAVLYGGLDYDATVNGTLVAKETLHIDKQDDLSKYTTSRSLRSKYNNLEWTLSEVQDIAKMFGNNYQIQLFSGVNGTESSFKNMSLTTPTLLHIATHGFYFEEDEIYDKVMENPNRYKFLSYRLLQKPTVETLAMRGSGLLFSGANVSLGGQKLPNGFEDGILTAEETSLINLESVDLTVLSACETGLGALSGDGVFGLQRGFKLAGVNSILMSLWEVDDKATSLLMKEFYKNYLQGKTKIQSLKSAQEYLRVMTKYSDPVYWAAWIFLDAIH